MAGTFEDLYNLCEELIKAAQDAVSATPGGPIEYAYVSPGPPAFDVVPQITVHVATVAPGDTLPLQPPLQPNFRFKVGQVLIAQLSLTVLRPAPIIDDRGEIPVYPSPDELTTAAFVTTCDLWAIWNHLLTKKREGVLFAGTCREFAVDPAIPINQQGGACGWQINVRCQINGYEALP